MSNDFGVGVGVKFHSAGFELGFELLVVFDDPVVHNHRAARSVGVGVSFAGLSVSGPSGVTNARLHFGKFLLAELGLKFLKLALGPNDLDPLVGQKGHARTVVAPVLQFL